MNQDGGQGFGGSNQDLDALFHKGGNNSNQKLIIAAVLALLALGGGAYYYFNHNGENSNQVAESDPEQTPPPAEDSTAALVHGNPSEGNHPASQPVPAPTPNSAVDHHPKNVTAEPADQKTQEHSPTPTKTEQLDHKAAPHEKHHATKLPKKTKHQELDLTQESSHDKSKTSVVLTSPENGASHPYDLSTPAEFKWEGGKGTLFFSRSEKMKPVARKFVSDKGLVKYRLLNPGQWYWKVTTSKGSSEVRSLIVADPIKRQISISSPQRDAGIQGTGGLISWIGDEKIAHYRVEITQNGNWDKPMFQFATTGTSLEITAVPAGSYELRVGGFSEVSGQWEYTDATSLQIQ